MKNVNQVTLLGRLGADPIQRATKSGVAVAHFSVATSRRIRAAEGEQDPEKQQDREETEWHRVVAWGREAENCTRFLRKGQPVLVQGMIRSRSFKGKDGLERTAFEIHADDVCFLGGGLPAGERMPAAVEEPVQMDVAM